MTKTPEEEPLPEIHPGRRVRGARIDAGVSLRELSERTGISAVRLGELERGMIDTLGAGEWQSVYRVLPGLAHQQPVKPMLHGIECKPGWYWVLVVDSDELELAQLFLDKHGEPRWRLTGASESIGSFRMAVHSGPIAHPYEGRWSGCPHAPEFRRGKRCVQCGTLEVSPDRPPMAMDSTQRAYEAREFMEDAISKPGERG